MIAATDLRAVLFDLDGTLVDSAPDLIAAVAALCREIGSPPPDAQAVRRVVSAGGRAMLRVGVAHADDAMIERLLPRFLEIYAAAMSVHTRLYDGIDKLLSRLEARGIAWGVVTNKPGWLARPLLEQMHLAERCAALVCGDCLAQKKPDPQPVLYACELAGVSVAGCVMVGDDERDIAAGRAAGTGTIAAAWGYLNGGDPHAWQADRVVASPREMVDVLGLV